MVARLIGLILIALGVSLASAQTSTVSPGDRTFNWTAPARCTDDTPLGSTPECTALIEHKVYCDSGVQYTIPMPATTYVAPAADFPPGTYVCHATAVNSAGESDPSNTTTFTVVAPSLPPRPPYDLTVTVDSTAYNIVEQENSLVMLPVGTVTAGTVCDSQVTAMGRYAVPRDQVTWYGNVEPLVVFADCG